MRWVLPSAMPVMCARKVAGERCPLFDGPGLPVDSVPAPGQPGQVGELRLVGAGRQRDHECNDHAREYVLQDVHRA